MSTLGKSKIKILTATTKIWYVTPRKVYFMPTKRLTTTIHSIKSVHVQSYSGSHYLAFGQYTHVI